MSHIASRSVATRGNLSSRPMLNGDNGNVLGITNYRDTSRTQSFTYDALNRITSGWTTADNGSLS